MPTVFFLKEQQCQRFCTKQKILECQPLKCRASLSLNGSVCISKSNSMCQGFSSSSCLFMVPVQHHERHSFRYCWRTFRHIWKVVAHLHHCGSASRVLDTKQISNDFLNKKNGLDHLPRKQCLQHLCSEQRRRTADQWLLSCAGNRGVRRSFHLTALEIQHPSCGPKQCS